MRGILAAAAVGGLLLSGCGSTQSPAADSVTDSTTPTTATTAVADPTTPATSSAAAVVQPASGPLVRGPHFAFHLPKGWLDDGRGQHGETVQAVNPASDDAPSQIVVEIVPGAPVDATRASQILRQRGVASPLIDDAVVIDGVRASHVHGLLKERGTAQRIDRFDVRSGGENVAITVATTRWMTPSYRDAVILPVLASWTWR